MKCPLFQEYSVESQDRHIEDHEVTRECWKEECAWWVETQDTCAIKQLALSLGYISLDTTQLLEKMPIARE